jgi:hypothetical protein
MHLVASDQYLDCSGFLPASCDSINVDLSVAEVLAAGGYGYVAFVAYDVDGITGAEFAVSGWPTGRGAPVLSGPSWCPDDALTLGNQLDGGGITSFPCEQASENGIVLIGYCSFGPLDEEDLPITLDYEASSFSYSADPHNYVLDCTVRYEEDIIAAACGCTIGGVEVAGPQCDEGQDGEGEGEDSDHNTYGTWDPPPAGHPSRELRVKLRPGIIRLPSGEIDAPLATVEIESDPLADLLEIARAEHVTKAYPGFRPSDATALLPSGRQVTLADFSQIYIVRFASEEVIPEVATRLRAHPAVLRVSPNILEIVQDGIAHPNDEEFEKQWGLYNTGECYAGPGTPGMDISAREAWSITTGSDASLIAIVDRTVDETHEDLEGKVSGELWGSGDTHSNHCAGIAAAWGNNSIGVAGVDWNATIHSEDFQRVNDIGHAVDAGSHVLNCCWHLDGYNEEVREAFANAYKLNRVAVVSMGNDDDFDPHYPAAFGQGIIAVGGFDNQGNRSWFSNMGSHIDVLAPGGSRIGSSYDCRDVYSTWQDDYYHYAGGTSAAAPHVSGLTGLLIACRPDLYNDDIENIIRLSASGEEFSPETGMGRVDAYEALNYGGPRSLFFHESAIGGAIHHTETVDVMRFLGTSGVEDGNYYAKRYRVRRWVDFPATFTRLPYVWGRGVESVGYSDADTCFGMGWCGVHGDLGWSGCYLQTYVYRVWEGNDWSEYIPCSPEAVEYHYSVLLPAATWWNECGDPASQPDVIPDWGEDYTCPGEESIEIRTQRIGVDGGVAYRYTSLDPQTYYRVTVCYCDCLQSADVCQSLWVDDEQLHGPMYVPDTPTTFSYVINPFHYTHDYWFDVYALAENCPGTAAAMAWILVEETFFLADVDDGNTGEREFLPREFRLSQNTPNPFNPATEICYSLPRACHVKLEVFDVQGEKVICLVDRWQEAGNCSVVWNADSLPSGVYFCRLKADGLEAVRKMVLSR